MIIACALYGEALTTISSVMSELASRSMEEETERTFKLFSRYAGEGEEDHIVSTPLPENAAILPEDLKVRPTPRVHSRYSTYLTPVITAAIDASVGRVCAVGGARRHDPRVRHRQWRNQR